MQLVDRDTAEVSFKVDEARKLPVGSIFSIKYQNLVGQRYLEVARGNGPMNAMLRPGATIPVNQTRPPLNLTVVFNGFKPLFQALNPNDINQLSFEIIQVLQGEGGTVNSLLARTASLTSTIADRDAVIGSLITNLNTVLDTVNARDERLSGLIVSLQQLVSGLAADRVADRGDPAADRRPDRPRRPASSRRHARRCATTSSSSAGSRPTSTTTGTSWSDFLRLTPQKANNFGRAGSYGSWFNFYLCSAGGHDRASAAAAPADPARTARPARRVSLQPALPDTAYRCNG